jgi:hypothetical protein
MKIPTHAAAAAALVAVLGGSPAAAQRLHVNDRWKDCAFVIDPSLTQSAWHQFVGEAGQVTYFRPLASARPLGKGHVEAALLQSATAIDDRDAAWNDTFSHPDSAHELVRGHALSFPGVMVRTGVSARVDVGAYVTKNFSSNYGVVGAQVQYGLLDDRQHRVAAAARVSASRLFGPEDLRLGVYGVDFLVSKEVSVLSPYAGVSGYLARGVERTSKVDLHDENVLGAQATAGVAVRLRGLRIAAEANVAKVPGYSMKVAFAV